MSIENAYFILLLTAFAGMLSQTLLRPTRVEHLLFAILCGSLSMTALQFLSAATNATYSLLFALGTCATCNVIWLISRAMFRGSDSIGARHYLVALTIALLVLANRSIDLFLTVEWLTPSQTEWVSRAVSEITKFLSSTVLALGFWESIRGFSKSTPVQKYQRSLFATAFFVGVFSCTVIGKGVLSESQQQMAMPWLVVLSAITILIATLTVLVWQHLGRKGSIAISSDRSFRLSDTEDSQLLQRISHLMEKEKLFLKQDLKMIDVAKMLDVSEYRVSRVIRGKTDSTNFNHFINAYRIAHAKQLFRAPQSQSWTVLVISMESGFASLAPFNRAFKAQEGCTPNQYRGRFLPGDPEQSHSVAN